ncbi:MAG: DNA repair protein RecN, partial [Bacteroidales bacterium]|nr:DNA repair protein RecN [Bacteroidales bacterium]
DRQDDAAIARLQSAKSQLSKIVSYYPEVEDIFNRLESSIIELRDIFSEIESLDENLSYSIERQQYVSQRLDTIYNLQTKHSVSTVAELLEIKSQLSDKLLAVTDLDGRINKLENQIAETEIQLRQKARVLSDRRHKTSRQIESELLPTLAELGMKEAQIVVELTETEHLLPNGTDAIRLMFNANRGGELREVGKVISGGELSRLMLALKSLIVKTNLLPTIIFDEIDTGVSGTIAVAMARIMRKMSRNTQVIAITHLPQVAGKANTHFKVYKESDEVSTQTSMKQLTEEQRVEEIATMLSTDKPTASAIETAKQLMS